MKTGSRSRIGGQSRAIRRMVVTAMLGAITALLAFTPVGMITLPPPFPAVTLVHIPVIVAALVEGPWVGVPVGLIFGLCSLIRAWGSGMVGLTLFFRNPLVSVLPRLIIPLAAWAAYALWRRIFKADGALDKLGVGVAAVVGTLTNTVLCLGAIVVLYGSELNALVQNLIALGGASNQYGNDGGAWLVAAVGVPNGLAEMVVAAIIVPLIKTAADAINRRGKGVKRPKLAATDVAAQAQTAILPTQPAPGLDALADASMAAAQSTVENAVLAEAAQENENG